MRNFFEVPAGWIAAARAAALVIAALAALGGCATPTSLAPGTAEADVISRFGRPAEVYSLDAPAQARRLAYPIGGLNQQTWMVDVDAQGRVLRVEAVISAEHFGRIRLDRDDMKLVRREFGPPYKAYTYELTGLTAWMYPYLEGGVWNSEMAVFFDASGVVRRVESGPDPRFLGGGNDGKSN